MSRFVRPETSILRLGNGDTLTVKKRLNRGEQARAYARMYMPTTDGKLKANPLESGIAMVCAFLVDWSLTDPDGRHVAIRGLSTAELEAILDLLDPVDFAEIKQAIEAHETAVFIEREQEKKLQAGENSGAAISPLPSGVDGASSGYVS